MTDSIQDEKIANEINNITEKLGDLLLKEFMKLPKELQMNIILIKSSQLLLANILCHVATNTKELGDIADSQGLELQELTFNCAHTGFSGKFDLNKH